MSLPDTIFIFALALVIFGPKKLPEIGRQIGKLVYEFRRASNEFKLQIEEELRSAEEADRQKQFAAQTSSLPAASVVSSEMSSDSSEALTVHPPSTGTQVSADSPSHAYSSTGEEEEEDWDSWSGDGTTTAEQAQDTGETTTEQTFGQSAATAKESTLEPSLEQAQQQIPEPMPVQTRDLHPEPTLEQIFEQSEEPAANEFPEQGFEQIGEQPHTQALAQTIEQPVEQAREQATNHHG